MSNELKSYKPYARWISAISGIIIIIAGLDASQVIQLFPDYASQINSILVIAGILAPIFAQEKRVVVAEQLIHEEYQSPEEPDAENIVVNLTLDGEDIVSGDGSGVDSEGIVPEDDDEA